MAVTLQYKGRDIPVFTCEPHWGTPVELRVMDRVIVREGLDTSEERIGTRPRPLYGLRYGTKELTEQEQGYIRRVVELPDALPFVMPVWVDKVKLTADYSLGEMSITVDATGSSLWETLTGYALIWRGFNDWELAELASVEGNALNLVSGLDYDWPEGAFAIPILVGWLSRAGKKQLDVNHGVFQADFEERFLTVDVTQEPAIQGEDVLVETGTVTVETEVLSPPAGAYLWYKADADGVHYSDGDLAIPLYNYSDYAPDMININDGNPLLGETEGKLYFSGTSPIDQNPHFLIGGLNGLPIWNWIDSCDVDTRRIDPALDWTGITIAWVIRKQAYFGSRYGSVGTALAVADASIIGSFGHLQARQILDDTENFSWEFFAPSEPGGQTISAPAVYDQWYLLTATFDYTEGIPRLKLNDSEVVGSALPGSGLFNTVGLSGDPEDQIAEMLIYNFKLTEDEEIALRTYLSGKYDIAITV